jgi:hypothetical protein
MLEAKHWSLGTRSIHTVTDLEMVSVVVSLIGLFCNVQTSKQPVMPLKYMP